MKITTLINSYIWVFFHPQLFQIPTANSPIQDFGEKITPAKFWETNFDVSLAGQFCFEVHEILNKSKFSKCSWNPIFFKKWSLSKNRIATYHQKFDHMKI